MNKYTLGTILGTALLGLAKRKGNKNTRLGRKIVTEYKIRQNYGQSCSFDDDFMPEEERTIGFDWDQGGLLEDGDEGYDENHDWDNITDKIEARINEISGEIDWSDVFREFRPNKHEKYEIYYDGYIDNIHEYLEYNDEHLEKIDEFKAIVTGYPSAGNLGFIYTHTVMPGEQQVAPPKTFEEVWDLANSIYEKIENEFRYKGIILHSRTYDYDGHWTESLYDAEGHGIDVRETIYLLTEDGWVPYEKPKSTYPKLRTR